MAKIQRNPLANEIAGLILKNYKPESTSDLTDILKQVCGSVVEGMLQGEMDNHLGYEKSDQGDKETANRRNGYSTKKIKTRFGETQIQTPRDREGTFNPQIVPKRTSDITGLEDKILSMYARGMSQRDIADSIEEMYDFRLSAEQISAITDRVMDRVNEWQNRPLAPIYAFVFVDCIYVDVRDDQGNARNQAVYVILGIDAEGHKDVLGLQVKPTESKSDWMQFFDTIKLRGVKDILFLSMDGVSGLEGGLKAIYPDTVVQRCIVHLIRNSLKYVRSCDYKEFCSTLKNVYGASSIEMCRDNFDAFIMRWQDRYPGAVRVWTEHRMHIEQLFNYTSNIRKVMYTTNAIESVNSSLRKVTKKGCFENEKSVLKVFFLRIENLTEKWSKKAMPGWSEVRNQLVAYDHIYARLRAHIPNY